MASYELKVMQVSCGQERVLRAFHTELEKIIYPIRIAL